MKLTRRRTALAAGTLAAAVALGTLIPVTAALADTGTVRIDASKTDQATKTAVEQAMSQLPKSADVQFTPQDPSNPISYSSGDWSAVGDSATTPAGQATPNDGHYAETDTTGFKYSIGGSVSVSVSSAIANAVSGKLSVSVGSSHSWEDSTSDSQTIRFSAKPGMTAWLEYKPNTATIVGTYSFDAPNGTHFVVENLGVGAPASFANKGLANDVYEVVEAPATVSAASLPADGLRPTAGDSVIQKATKQLNATNDHRLVTDGAK